MCQPRVVETVQVAQAVVPTQAVVQAPVVASTPSIYVLNSVPAIPGGSTEYASRTNRYPDISLVDVDRLAVQALEMQRAAGDSQADYHSRTLSFLEQLVEIQKPVAEIIARGEAASRVLATAGLEANLKLQDGLTAGREKTILEKTCLKCHTGKKAKGGFRLDDVVTPEKARKAMIQVASKQMPPDGTTDSNRLLLIGDLITLSEED